MIAWGVLAERPELLALAGGAVALGGVALVNAGRRGRLRRREAAAPAAAGGRAEAPG